MAALIAPGCVRYTVHGQYDGEAIANIVDMDIDTQLGGDRDENVQNLAGVILNEWSDHILPRVDDNYLAQAVSWVDLDSEDGSTGQRASTSEHTWPAVGGRTGPSQPGNVAARVRKGGAARRGQRAGRMYLVGVMESDTDEVNPNYLVDGQVQAWNEALADFLAGVNQDTPYEADMVVIHTIGGVYESHNDVQDLTIERRLASQRRRLGW